MDKPFSTSLVHDLCSQQVAMCMFNVNESQALQYYQRIKNLAKVRARERSERLISQSVRVHEMDEVNCKPINCQ